MKRARTWCEMYSFPGSRASAKLKGVFGDPDLQIVRLRRKKRPGRVSLSIQLCNYRFHCNAARGMHSSPNIIWNVCSSGFQ